MRTCTGGCCRRCSGSSAPAPWRCGTGRHAQCGRRPRTTRHQSQYWPCGRDLSINHLEQHPAISREKYLSCQSISGLEPSSPSLYGLHLSISSVLYHRKQTIISFLVTWMSMSFERSLAFFFWTSKYTHDYSAGFWCCMSVHLCNLTGTLSRTKLVWESLF